MNTRRLLAAAAGAAFVLGVGSAQTSAPILLHGGAPAVSPDGSAIAFLSDRDGPTDVYVISADGTGERRLTRTTEVAIRARCRVSASREVARIVGVGGFRPFCR
ncbi:MAG: hypothetical protein ABI682_00820 [Acidobacteriota bacterium]